jgi:hypothetical protein
MARTYRTVDEICREELEEERAARTEAQRAAAIQRREDRRRREETRRALAAQHQRYAIRASIERSWIDG